MKRPPNKNPQQGDKMGIGKRLWYICIAVPLNTTSFPYLALLILAPHQLECRRRVTRIGEGGRGEGGKEGGGLVWDKTRHILRREDPDIDREPDLLLGRVRSSFEGGVGIPGALVGFLSPN